MTDAATPYPSAPVSTRGQRIAGRVSAERWQRLVWDAMQREAILTEVAAKQKTVNSWRKSLREVAPEVGWSQYRHWCRRYSTAEGPGWESLLDERIPPEPVRIVEPVRRAACLLRRGSPAISCEAARKALRAEFGDEGAISDASLRRIWAAAGLAQSRGGSRPRGKRYDHGGGLALIAAAEAETQAALRLGQAIRSAAERSAASQEPVPASAEPAGRDQGRFTADYNRNLRAGLQPGDADPRRRSDEVKRKRRALCQMRTLKHSPENLAAKILAMGLTPLLTEKHGFDGLGGPRAESLEVLGIHAYMPATLDKTLAEWAVLDVSDALWEGHARQWVNLVKHWCERLPWWQRLVVYVDSTQDPYWTRQYALSGKVSSVGRVMPCLSQIAVASGASPPLLICTLAGQATLKTHLVPVLRKLEGIVGEGEVGRITVIDAEMCATKTLAALMAMKPARVFVTVLKGWHNRNVKFKPAGPSQAYRDRDEVRDGSVVLCGEGAPAEGLHLRAVEMVRTGSRHPKPTIFLTNAPVTEVKDGLEKLSTTEVPDVYLSRWPNQEGRFRNQRNGGGLERTHGYGGEFVENVALDTALEKAQRAYQRAETKVAEAEHTLQQAQARKESAIEAGGREPVLNQACKMAESALRAAKKRLQDATKDLDAKRTTPRKIFKRDTTRQSIATVAAMTMAMLVEFVLKEYFGDVRMELRTYIENFVDLPVTVVTSHNRVLYHIHASPRDPRSAELLRCACIEITRRGLTKDGRLLVYEVVDPPGQ